MQPEHVAASQRKKTKKKSKPNYRAFWLFTYLIIHFFLLISYFEMEINAC